MKYEVYRYNTDRMVRDAARKQGVPKKQRHSQELRKRVLWEVCDRLFQGSMARQRWVQERREGETWSESEAFHGFAKAEFVIQAETVADIVGRSLVVVERPELLEALWQSKLSVDVTSLDWEKIPTTFSVAVPRCTIKDVATGPCYVVHGDVGRLVNEAGGWLSTSMWTPGMVGTGVAVFMQGLKGRHGDCEKYQVVPYELLGMALAGYEPFMELRDTLTETALFSKDGVVDETSTREIHQRLRMLGALLVYMQACPDMVRPGLPETLKAREAYHKAQAPKVLTLGMPKVSRPHGSPSPHWRHWHFRSYPRRPDGTRRKGVVFVTGSWVNPPEHAETVEGPGKEFG